MPPSSPLLNRDRSRQRRSPGHGAARTMYLLGGGILGSLPLFVLLPSYLLSRINCNAVRYAQNPFFSTQGAFLIALGVWVVLTVVNSALKRTSDARRAFGMGVTWMLIADFILAGFIFVAEIHACLRATPF